MRRGSLPGETLCNPNPERPRRDKQNVAHMRAPLATYIAAGDAERVGLTRALITRNAWWGALMRCTRGRRTARTLGRCDLKPSQDTVWLKVLSS